MPSPYNLSRPYTDTRLWQEVQTLCKAANVSRVCTHSLRGLQSTAKHYADSGAIADRATAEASGTLLGQKITVPERVRLASALNLAERSELRAALDRSPEA